MTANAISRQLRRLGFNPVAPSDRNRQGIRVSTGGAGRVRVTADLDSHREARELAMTARHELVRNGRTVESSLADNAFYVVS